MRFIRNAVFACIAGMCLMCAPVQAETPSLEVNIPVTCSGRNAHTFTISSNDAPLPKKTEMTLNNIQGNFTVILSEPKNYHYAITDDQKDTYEVSVLVTSDKSGKLSSELTATKDGKYKKDIIYSYDGSKPEELGKKTATKKPEPVKKKKTSVINTGDPTEIAKWCAGLGISAVLAITLSKKVKNNEK